MRSVATRQQSRERGCVERHVMNPGWLRIESIGAWLLAISAGAVGAGLIVTGMFEDLFDVVRQWLGRHP